MIILEKLKGDFLPKVRELKSFTYLPGSDEEITVFFKSHASAYQTDKYLPLLSQSKIEGYVELIITRALDAQGGRLFAPKDKVTLMRDVDPDFLTEVGNAILGVDDEGAAEIEKERKEIAKK